MKNTKEKQQIILAARLYLGSVDYVTVHQQQKFYNKLMKKCEKLAEKLGCDHGDVFNQAIEKAQSLGYIRPIVGKDL